MKYETSRDVVKKRIWFYLMIILYPHTYIQRRSTHNACLVTLLLCLIFINYII